MSEKILVPVLGESINEATVSKWLKNVGDVVNVDEAIVELETDKVNLEVPASIGGVLSEVNSNEGDTVQVGSVLGIISDSKVNVENIKNENSEINVEKKKFNKDEIVKAKEDNKENLKTLIDYTINRHYPELKDSNNQALSLLKIVMEKQIKLVTDWMRVGFIHGVMNTDNMTISGETIDYGPCAFMDNYDPETVFLSLIHISSPRD